MDGDKLRRRPRRRERVESGSTTTAARVAKISPTRPDPTERVISTNIIGNYIWTASRKESCCLAIFFLLVFFIFRGKVRLRRRRRSESFFVLLCPSLLICYIRWMKWSMQHCVGSSTCELHSILYSFRNRPSASLSIQQISSARLIHSWSSKKHTQYTQTPNNPTRWSSSINSPLSLSHYHPDARGNALGVEWTEIKARILTIFGWYENKFERHLEPTSPLCLLLVFRETKLTSSSSSIWLLQLDAFKTCVRV